MTHFVFLLADWLMSAGFLLMLTSVPLQQQEHVYMLILGLPGLQCDSEDVEMHCRFQAQSDTVAVFTYGSSTFKQLGNIRRARLMDASNKDCSLGNVTTGAYFQQTSQQRETITLITLMYTH